MKTKKIITAIFLLLGFFYKAQTGLPVGVENDPVTTVATAGCVCSGSLFDYSQITGWFNEHHGNGVPPVASLTVCSSNNGSVMANAASVDFNGACDGIRNRVYAPIPTGPLTPTWTSDFTFVFNPVGGQRPTYMPAHDIFFYSENNQNLQVNALANFCSPVNAAQSMNTSNSAIGISLNCTVALNAGCPSVMAGGVDIGNYFLNAYSRVGAGGALVSTPIPLINGVTTYFIRLQRTSNNQGWLSVYLDAAYSNLYSAVCFSINPAMPNLNYIQHSVGLLGSCERSLSAKISNLKVCGTAVCPPPLNLSFSMNSKFCFGEPMIATPGPIAASAYSWLIEECNQAGVVSNPHYLGAFNFVGAPNSFNFLFASLHHGFNQIHQIQCNQFYRITLTATVCGTTYTTFKIVQVRCLPTANAGPDHLICPGQSVQIGSANVYTSYSWASTPAGFSSNLSNPVVTPTVPTSYTVTVFDINTGCSNTDVVNVGFYPVPNVNAGPDLLICGNGGTVPIGSIANANSPTTYTWTPGPSASASLSSNPWSCPGNPGGAYHCPHPMASVTATTTFTLAATNTHGCTSSDQVTIYVSPVPTANAGPDQTACIIPNLTNPVLLDGSGSSSGPGYSYSWAPAAGLTYPCGNPNCSSTIASPTVTTSYTLTVTYTAPNGQTCVSTDVVTVYVGNAIADAGNDQTICLATPQSVFLGGYTTATGPGYTYSWAPTNTLVFPTHITTPATPTVTTTYTLTVSYTSPTGVTCPSHTDQVTVFVGNPVADAGPDQVVCLTPPLSNPVTLGGPNTTSGSGYSYSWSPGGLTYPACGNNPNCPTAVATPGVSTVYTLTVVYTSPTGQTCTATDQATVLVGNPMANAGPDKVVCPYVIQGGPPQSASIGVSFSGGTAAWLPNNGTLSSQINVPTTATPMVNTSYTLTVTDAATGCQSSDVVNVIVACPSPIADAGNDQKVCCGGGVVNLNGSATGGVPPYSYNWSPLTGIAGGSTSASPVIDLCKVPGFGQGASIVYTLTVTDAMGNTSTDVVTVTTAHLIADAGPDQIVCCSSMNVNLNLGGTPLSTGPAALGGFAPYTYSWTTSLATGVNVSFTNTNSAHPTYQALGHCKDEVFNLTVTDANGCTATSAITVATDLTCRMALPEAISNTMSISPNPNNGVFTLQSRKQVNNTVVEILDPLGKIVFKKQFAVLNSEQINVSELSNGIYFVRITGEGGINETHKVVKE